MLAFGDRCPQCGGAWDIRPEMLGKPAADFDSCAFRCHRCGLGFSNASTPNGRVSITATPQLNVPEQARPGLTDALAGAINVHNRPTKAKKFCSGRSEDAVTWTVVAGLRAVGAIGALVGEPDLGEPEALLLWGHPVAGSRAAEVLELLVQVSDRLEEHPKRRSEPDVIALWPELLALVEAKHGSANDSQPGYVGYDKYLAARELFSVDEIAVRSEGSYQLTRNWVIGAAMAERLGVPLRLVNLGPAGVAEHAANFAALLEQTPGRRFEHRTWQQALGDTSPPDWLIDYAELNGLCS
ncbi:hypothetical protein [Conexibacter sp. SYSU D00693]|uniref:hypothetical protein n=1 Tax=Conexibacter sp. SYSU D00693 TaxID=2812560 RepID=UPI00196B4930|nr:hypothetical protein [Conexibacter sp. SYSU D00693]